MKPDEATFDLDSFIQAFEREKKTGAEFEGEAWCDYARTGLALTEMMTVSNEGNVIFSRFLKQSVNGTLTWDRTQCIK